MSLRRFKPITRARYLAKQEVSMKLEPWRGNNVLITDARGGAVLTLDERGNATIARDALDVRRPLQEFSSLARLATSVALWIEWNIVERNELRADDIHPQIRMQVAKLSAGLVDERS